MREGEAKEAILHELAVQLDVYQNLNGDFVDDDGHYNYTQWGILNFTRGIIEGLKIALLLFGLRYQDIDGELVKIWKERKERSDDKNHKKRN